MTTTFLILCALLSPVADAKPSQAAAARGFLARMGAVADKIDTLLNALEEPAAMNDRARYAANLAELEKQGAAADAYIAKADKLLKRTDLPRGKEPVILRGARMSWLETPAVPDAGVDAQALAGARLNVLAAQFSLLSIALSTENHEGQRLTHQAELAKARAALAQAKAKR